MEGVPNLGFKNILGVKGADTSQCRVNYSVDGHSRGYQDFGITRFEGQSTIERIDPNNDGMLTATYDDAIFQYMTDNASTLLSGCPATVFFDVGGEIVRMAGEVLSTDIQSTGIYEFLFLMSAIAGIAIPIAVISRGIWVAKKAALAVTEETNAEDNLEYYVGHDGKEYWRIKNRRYHG